jgi:hypothetical protein
MPYAVIRMSGRKHSVVTGELAADKRHEFEHAKYILLVRSAGNENAEGEYYIIESANFG